MSINSSVKNDKTRSLAGLYTFGNISNYIQISLNLLHFASLIKEVDAIYFTFPPLSLLHTLRTAPGFRIAPDCPFPRRLL